MSTAVSTTILFRVPSGVPGSITRPDATIVESGFFNPANVCTAFGQPVKLVAGQLQNIQSGDTAANFFGILSRIAPSIAGDNLQSLVSGTPNPQTIQGIVRRGYVNVLCTIGTPVRGNPVYMRLVAAAGPKNIGDLEATIDQTVVESAQGGNTGNATMGAITLTGSTPLQVGVYKALFTAATVFTLIKPDGTQGKVGATGAVYSAEGLSFTITAGGTAMVNGDALLITVTNNNQALNGVLWASDGVDAQLNAEVSILGLQ